MRASPVNAVATRAAPKFIVVFTGKRFETVTDLGFGYGLQECVAVQAAGEGCAVASQIESAQNFHRLLIRDLGAGMKPGLHNRMHEEPAIPGRDIDSQEP